MSYLAHCYPYTFTDLKEDLDSLINAPDRKECMKREVLCETRAGNSCFLVTVSNFGKLSYNLDCVCFFVCSMVFNATFSNISVISWQSVLLVDENGGRGENHRAVASH